MASIFPFSNTSGDLCQSFTDNRYGDNPGDFLHPELPADPGRDVKHEALKTIIAQGSTEVPNHTRSPWPNTSGDLCQSFTDDRFGTNPGDYRRPELPADPGHDVKHEALKTIIDQGSTEVPNHMRSPWPNTSGDLCQSFTDDRFGTSPGDYPHPELDVEHEELKTQAVTTITTEPGRIRYLWSVDAKKLESSDKQIASPDCEHGAAIFIMRIVATQVSMNKGGASFKRSEGKGHVTVKCLQGAADRQVRYQLWIGRRIDACTTRPGREDRKIVEHNFTRSASSGLPKGEEEWDFKSFVEPGSSTFVVCLEIFTDDDFAAGGAPGDNPGDFLHPELPADPGRDVKHEALKTIVAQGSTEVPNHTRFPSSSAPLPPTCVGRPRVLQSADQSHKATLCPQKCEDYDMEEKALDRDDISETSTVLAKSRSTLRRALQRERAASGRTNIEPKSKDAAVHCDLINSTAVTNLQAKLNRERLKLVAMKGKLASARRAFGLHSDSDHSSDSDMSSQADFGDSDQKTNSAEEHTGDEQPDSDEDSSLNNNIEIGDVAQITGLVSDTGVQLNERYGKVISYDPANGRFGIRLIDNRTVAIRAENLAVGMKGDELSDEDENLLLGLQPTAEEIQKLPYLERMRALDSDKV